MLQAQTQKPLSTPHVPVSWGELIDKLTILQIKNERIGAADARANVAKEMALLAAIAAPILAGDEAIKNLAAQLKSLNETLWDIEDHIRAKDAAGAFDAEFIALARSVYQRNDERAALKKQINQALKSELTEEKSYSRPSG